MLFLPTASLASIVITAGWRAVRILPAKHYVIYLTFLFSAGGPHEYAALQPAVSSGKLPNEILLLSRVVLASGDSPCSFPFTRFRLISPLILSQS